MKKKIILFLSVLLVAMFITGCSATINPEALEKSNEVASEVAKNMGEYKLPDGYDMSYPDSKDTSRFYLTSEAEGKVTLRAEYQISNKEAELVCFTVEDRDDERTLGFVMTLAIIVAFAFGILLGSI